MRVLIIEDEASVAQNLCDLLKEIDPGIKILGVLETIEDTIAWIDKEEVPDLGFFDIRIADGNSFEIFEKREARFPVIFTTAYDEFALKAFEVNSIDYLMKPIKKEGLIRALDKYRSFFPNQLKEEVLKLSALVQELTHGPQKKYKKSFLAYVKDKIIPLRTENIAYFSLENEIIYCYTHDGERYRITEVLDKIQAALNPEDFFRINRQFICSRKAVHSASVYFQRKLRLEVRPPFSQEIIISKLKITSFREWLSGT